MSYPNTPCSKRNMHKVKSSIVWKYFKEIDSSFARCNLCNLTFSYRTSISNLKKHLDNKHPKYYSIQIKENHSNDEAKTAPVTYESLHESFDADGLEAIQSQDENHGGNQSGASAVESMVVAPDTFQPEIVFEDDTVSSVIEKDHVIQHKEENDQGNTTSFTVKSVIIPENSVQQITKKTDGGNIIIELRVNDGNMTNRLPQDEFSAFGEYTAHELRSLKEPKYAFILAELKQKVNAAFHEATLKRVLLDGPSMSSTTVQTAYTLPAGLEISSTLPNTLEENVAANVGLTE